MKHKSNKKSKRKTYRLIVPLTEAQKRRFEAKFSMHGSKTHFERQTGHARLSVTRILRDGRGGKQIVQAMESYCKQEK